MPFQRHILHNQVCSAFGQIIITSFAALPKAYLGREPSLVWSCLISFLCVCV